jgi:hypothetical protein
MKVWLTTSAGVVLPATRVCRARASTSDALYMACQRATRHEQGPRATPRQQHSTASSTGAPRCPVLPRNTQLGLACVGTGGVLPALMQHSAHARAVQHSTHNTNIDRREHHACERRELQDDVTMHCACTSCVCARVCVRARVRVHADALTSRVMSVYATLSNSD